MNCQTTDELIRGGRLGDLSPAEQRRFDAHLELCARCRTLLHPDLYAQPLQPPRELLASILQETSGPVCGRARELLAYRLDGGLDSLDSRLVDAHADDCSSCDALRVAFSRLNEDLPAMRELEPDAAFANHVFNLTSRSRTPRRHRSSEQVWSFWNRLVQRPRFAWETAYVGAMLFWLVLGAPLLALPDTPPDVRAYLPNSSGTRSAIRALRDPVSDLGRRTSGAARHSLASRTDELRQDLRRRSAAVKAITEEAREAVNRFIQQELDNDLRQE